MENVGLPNNVLAKLDGKVNVLLFDSIHQLFWPLGKETLATNVSLCQVVITGLAKMLPNRKP